VKFLGVDATNLVAETRSLPLYLHGLHGTRLHPRLWRILLPRDSRSYARTPIRLVEHRSRIHKFSAIPEQFHNIVYHQSASLCLPASVGVLW
jgi:hypothetical protein